MNFADRLKEFLSGVDSYISGKNLSPTKLNTDFEIADTFSMEQLQKLTKEECFDYAFMLYQYADHVAFEKANCETVVNWCEANLNSIIASEIQEMSGEFLKHDIKVATIVRTHDLANKIHEWKITAQARLEPLKSRENNVRRKAEILLEKGRRK